MEAISADQEDEIEALRAIYEQEYTDISQTPPCFMIKLANLDHDFKSPLCLKITFPPKYPLEVPRIELPIRSGVLSPDHQHQLLGHLNEVAEENIGLGMVYTLVEAAKDWLNTSPDISNTMKTTPESEELATDDSRNAVEVNLTEPKCTGGKWDFVIGLIGKPSAGKSTFFNAATTMDQAKTGAHPFTTIEPNIGKAFYTITCPCEGLSVRCDAAHGHDSAGRRHVPVLLKDVAGLVPGACEGKGRGNRFLNDLLDADVLMHIVDVSGCTNEKGEETVGYDPMLDVSWLQQEIHRWIYDNIKEKWDAICRRPARLVDMFTGYHANKATIYAAFKMAGVDSKSLGGIGQWPDSTLQRLVDCFLQVRFPIFIALNKADVPSAEPNVTRLQELFGAGSCMCVSARAECTLQRLACTGAIQYDTTSGCVKEMQTLSNTDAQQLEYIQQHMLNKYGSCNIHAALSAAVRLRSPCYAFPVQCLEALTSVDRYRDLSPGVLRDCVPLRPHTTVLQLYTALTHYPLLLAEGDFIRAECVPGLKNGKKRIMKKDEEISVDNCVLKIFTNRKVSKVKYKE